MWNRPKSRLRLRPRESAQPTSYTPIGSLELMLIAAALLAVAIVLLTR
ncbi:MAG: hypothetical protein ACXVEF_23255 [Polyangiales bacterium]